MTHTPTEQGLYVLAGYCVGYIVAVALWLWLEGAMTGHDFNVCDRHAAQHVGMGYGWLRFFHRIHLVRASGAQNPAGRRSFFWVRSPQ